MGKGIAVTLTADGCCRPCRIADIGLGGAEVHLDGATPRNLEVRLNHPRAGVVYATRAWSTNGVMGIAFDDLARARGFVAQCQALADGQTERQVSRGNTAAPSEVPLPA